VEELKTGLDLVLENVADEPKVSGSEYTLGCPIYFKNHKNMVAQKYVILNGIKMHFLSF
jgi:hypothetical protein